MPRSILVLLCAAGIAGTVAGIARAAGRHVIGQKNKAFSKAEITIKPGDTILFKNDDAVTHNVFSSSSANKFNVKAQAPGSTSPVTFPTEGIVEVRCAIHPRMKLIVHVKK